MQHDSAAEANRAEGEANRAPDTRRHAAGRDRTVVRAHHQRVDVAFRDLIERRGAARDECGADARDGAVDDVERAVDGQVVARRRREHHQGVQPDLHHHQKVVDERHRAGFAE